MTPQSRELFRISLLQQLVGVADAGLPLPSLVTGARLDGHAAANEELTRGELVYLQDKGLVALMVRTVSPENKRWRITAAGRDFLAEEGLG